MSDAIKPTSTALSWAAWILATLYAAVSLSPLAPFAVPTQLVLSISALVPMIFVFVHGAAQYRLRDALVFAVLTLVISNIFENMSILTGFPFGNYHYSDNLGWKIFLVPVLIGPAYLGMGYLSWTLARVLIGDTDNSTVRVVGVPLIASFLMVAWDLTFDPWSSTLIGSWIWHDGGSFFGVPFSNFIGWYFTVYVFFQLFALYVQRVRGGKLAKPAPTLWWSAVVMYGITALRPLLRFWFPSPHAETVTDLAGVVWNVDDIFANGALLAVFTMGAFTLLAILRLTARQDSVR
jgi:uncharacterized membrane protein